MTQPPAPAQSVGKQLKTRTCFFGARRRFPQLARRAGQLALALALLLPDGHAQQRLDRLAHGGGGGALEEDHADDKARPDAHPLVLVVHSIFAFYHFFSDLGS